MTKGQFKVKFYSVPTQLEKHPQTAAVKLTLHREQHEVQNSESLHQATRCTSSALLERLAQHSRLLAPCSHRKWDTQHLEINRRTCALKQKYAVYNHPEAERSELTKIPFRSPEVRRTARSAGKPSDTLRSSWGKTTGRMRPHSAPLWFQIRARLHSWKHFLSGKAWRRCVKTHRWAAGRPGASAQPSDSKPYLRVVVVRIGSGRRTGGNLEPHTAH